MARVSGRRIVITGAASGIGRRTAQLFVAERAKLTLLDQNAAALAEIADGILFLTSAESSYVTGSTLAMDGGRSFH